MHLGSLSRLGFFGTPRLGRFDVEFLVLAGGGGGKAQAGAGAGGYICSKQDERSGRNSDPVPLERISRGNEYQVTVGAGGSNSNGGDSVFGSHTALGGGMGSYQSYSNDPNADACSPNSGCWYYGKSGGCGGGGGAQTAQSDWALAGYSNNSVPAGSGTANQGYNGGRGSWYSKGKGGGTGSSTYLGNWVAAGGGTNSTITGVSVSRGKGGGGSTSTGGGTSQSDDGPNSGQGGSHSSYLTGQSGVVIIAYPKIYPPVRTIGTSLTMQDDQGSNVQSISELSTRNGYRVYVFTNGDDPIRW
jgi:hypothetical protein